jgi:hypothetical protein
MKLKKIKMKLEESSIKLLGKIRRFCFKVVMEPGKVTIGFMLALGYIKLLNTWKPLVFSYKDFHKMYTDYFHIKNLSGLNFEAVRKFGIGTRVRRRLVRKCDKEMRRKFKYMRIHAYYSLGCYKPPQSKNTK